MRIQEAVAALVNGRCQKFALYGPEPFFKERFIRIVKARTNCSIYYPDTADEALSEISLDTLFDPSRAFVFVDFDKMKLERFVKPIQNWNGVLVLTLSDKADMKVRAMTEILARVGVVSCERLKEGYGNEYQLWVLSAIREAGFEPDDGVEDAIYSRVGPDLFVLSCELDKLFLVKGLDKRVTKQDVERYVQVSARSSAYDVLDHLLRGDVPKAFKTMESFCRSADTPEELLKFLGSYFEKLYRMLLLKEQGLSPEDIASIVGIPSFHVKTRYLPRALAMGKHEIADKIDQICGLEIGFRSFRGDKRVLFDRFIFSFSKPPES